MKIRSIIQKSRSNFELTLLVLALAFLALQAEGFQYRPCNCEDPAPHGSELNIELKDFFFKYQNL